MDADVLDALPPLRHQLLPERLVLARLKQVRLCVELGLANGLRFFRRFRCHYVLNNFMLVENVYLVKTDFG